MSKKKTKSTEQTTFEQKTVQLVNMRDMLAERIEDARGELPTAITTARIAVLEQEVLSLRSQLIEERVYRRLVQTILAEYNIEWPPVSKDNV